MRGQLKRWTGRLFQTVLLLILIGVYAIGEGRADAQTPRPETVGPRNERIPLADYARVFHVAPGGSDRDGDGTAGRPWGSLHHALSQISDAGANKRSAVLVAEGTYRGATVQMKPHVDLFGGFEPSGWHRDIVAHVVVLDGEKTRRVVLGADHARLDGFTLTNGRPREPGGAILCEGTSPTITNNVLSGNATLEPEDYVYGLLHQVGNDGGAIACINGASPVIANNLIAGNSTAIGGGGGIACRNRSIPTITNNVICDNVTGVKDNNPDKKRRARSSNGAGISCTNAAMKQGEDGRMLRMTISNNVIINNRVGGNSDAGGIYCEYDSSPEISGNYLLGNLAEDDGGGIYVMKSSEPIIASNIIAGNKGGGAVRLSKEGRARIVDNLIFANETGGLNCVGSWMVLANNTIADNTGRGLAFANPTRHIKSSIVLNNIIHGNSETGIRVEGEPPLVSHCNVEGGHPGEGNLNQDPRFENDQRTGKIDSMTCDAVRALTVISTAEDLADPSALAGRVIQVGDKWSVIRAASARRITAWGDLRGAEQSEAATFTISPTYRLRPGSPCIGKGAPLNAVDQDLTADGGSSGAVDIGASALHAGNKTK